MEALGKFYFTFLSIGSLIPVLFTLLVAIFLLAIPRSSRATWWLGMSFLLLAVFNAPYFCR